MYGMVGWTGKEAVIAPGARPRCVFCWHFALHGSSSAWSDIEIPKVFIM